MPQADTHESMIHNAVTDSHERDDASPQPVDPADRSQYGLPSNMLQQLQQAWANHALQRVTLSQFRGDVAHPDFTELQKIILRPVLLQDRWQVSAVWRYPTRDITRNYAWDKFVQQLSDWCQYCRQINVLTQQHDSQYKRKKQQWHCHEQQLAFAPRIEASHNRHKHRPIDQQAVFLQLLGVTDRKGQVIPAMARKWKQINRFIELFGDAIQTAALPLDQPVEVVDFGAGKGYLTFALYAYLQQQGYQPRVTGIELRQELADLCRQAAQQAGFDQLAFYQGDVRSYQPARTDVMIALHACDIATDYAIHSGIRLGARIIMCAPCCHKELRPQLQSPALLAPMLQHGIHAAQHAEMLTDSVRALLLSAHGYQCKVIEFVSPEHTAKNKMILAIRKPGADQQEPNAELMAQVRTLLDAHGIHQQTLLQLLQAPA